ncbi:uncharacterized protein IL334_007765 [Kwoniella shivajii]|uniref:BCAS3 WD40 domain-containing protein n=1 Tax=Kwoniella shivajii TaxID=564305 RepID=A0ABZ1D9K4_9TREE|nr:hypothetical protein IL334_007765 [Kwoniella shivajii]
MSHLPSLAGMTSLKGFLPTSPTKQSTKLSSITANGTSASSGTRAIWQHGDLADGRGKIPLLLVTSKSHILQVFAIYTNNIPDDPHIPEIFPSPEEICSVPSIKYDKSTRRSKLDEVEIVPSKEGSEQVLSMTLLENNSELLVALLIASETSRKLSKKSLALVIVSLNTGVVVRKVELGVGIAATVHSTSRIIAVTVAQPIPAIHILDAITYQPLPFSPITQIASNSHTNLPIISLSGRLLAFATSESPRAPGPDGLGSIVTSTSLHASRASSSERRRPLSSGQDTQAAILSSAVEIGGGVARGVWAGIKMGAKAANRARNTRLAKSAPTDTSGISAVDETEDLESESRSLDESSVLEEMSPSSPNIPHSEWIKVVDLFPRPANKARSRQSRRPSSTSKRTESKASNQYSVDDAIEGFETIAHFRLPSSSSLPIDPTSPNQSHRLSNNRSHPIAHLSFSPNGTQLLAAQDDGKSFHIVEFHPAGLDRGNVKGEVKGQVWHLYELRRGHTAAIVKEVRWDEEGKWVGVGTGKGTVHVFPITPSGGPPSASTHATDKFVNPSQLHPLSTVISPTARLRPRLSPHDTDPLAAPNKAPPSEEAVFNFLSLRQHPLSRKTFYQDISMFRPSSNTLELARLSVHPMEHANATEKETRSLQRRGSALTEMMRSKAFGEGSDLGVEANVKAAWSLPDGVDEELLVDGTSLAIHQLSLHGSAQSKSLAHAEIRTHCISSSILPSSIYLSRQLEFFASRPIDEYSPLSILDLEARQRKLLFRQEVEAFSPEIKAFDEPLLSALHSVMEEKPSTQLPGLPNGPPSSKRWPATIPIQSVAAGLNESVDRVRREYVRAQYIRNKRRANEKAGLSLSFDEDSISINNSSFSGKNEDDDGELDSSSSPYSNILPTNSSTSNTTSTTESTDDIGANGDGEFANDDVEVDEEWNTQNWEEEYNKAVESDSPQELVLGLMDEEEEERRKWQIKREKLKKEYAK